MKRYGAFILGASLLPIAIIIGATWNATWESLPQGNELASNLDTRIQEFKAEVRKRASVETIWGNSSDDNGLARIGSARSFSGPSIPTDIDGPGQYNSAAGAYAGTTLTTTEIGGTADIGAGRLWLDTDGPDDVAGTLDDNQLLAWNETVNGWLPVVSRDFQAAGAGGQNAIYNGSFEVTDGFGGTGTPAGWALVNTPTIAYVDPPASPNAGEGIALRTTATGSALEGVRQALPKLKASTTYIYAVVVQNQNATFAGCTLKVSDGTTTATAVNQGVNSETMQVQHTTTGGPATVNVDLLSTNDTDICDWDYVTVYEKNTSVMTPGMVTCYDTDASTDSDIYTTHGTWADAKVSCAVTIPGPGYMLDVRGQLVADNETAATASLAARLRMNGATVAMAIGTAQPNEAGADKFSDVVVVPLFYAQPFVSSAPGTTLTFTIEGTPSDHSANPSFDRNVSIDDGEALNDVGTDGANLKTTLEVSLIPTR